MNWFNGMHICIFTAQMISVFLDYKQDESYTPSKLAVRVGSNFHDLTVTIATYIAIYKLLL